MTMYILNQHFFGHKEYHRDIPCAPCFFYKYPAAPCPPHSAFYLSAPRAYTLTSSSRRLLRYLSLSFTVACVRLGRRFVSRTEGAASGEAHIRSVRQQNCRTEHIPVELHTIILVYVEYINNIDMAERQKTCRSAEDRSLEMYNDKTRQQGVSFRTSPMAMPRRQAPMPSRDLPNLNRPTPMPNRRRCDGSLADTRMDMEANIPPRLGTQSANEHTEPLCMNICGSDCTGGKCGGWGLEKHPLAMVYSPCQAFKGLYAVDAALERGTIFSELDLPFEAAKSRKGIIC